MVDRPRIPVDVERQILVEAGHRCAVCGTPLPLEQAHIVPWREVKEHATENLICMCANCHARADKEKWGASSLRAYKQKPWVLRTAGVKIDAANPQSPIIGDVDVSIPYGYVMSAVERTPAAKQFQVYAEPISTVRGHPNPHSQDVVLEFDVTNPNELDMRIQAVSVEVTEYHTVDIVGVDPVASGGDVRRYFCDISKTPGLYNAVQLSTGYNFIKLTRGELERFGVNVNTVDEGIYLLGVSVGYSIGESSGVTVARRVDRVVGFFGGNQRRARSSPRTACRQSP